MIVEEKLLVVIELGYVHKVQMQGSNLIFSRHLHRHPISKGVSGSPTHSTAGLIGVSRAWCTAIAFRNSRQVKVHPTSAITIEG
jgi:hypothetical protein